MKFRCLRRGLSDGLGFHILRNYAAFLFVFVRLSMSKESPKQRAAPDRSDVNLGTLYMKIHVECHSGYKVNERPIKFWIDERVLFVESIEDQWYGPNALYFRLRADDGNTYVIAYNEATDEWTLGSMRLNDLSPTPR